MARSNEFMRQAAQEYDPEEFPPDIPTDRPTPSRTYGWLLGGKDNFQVDRDFVLAMCEVFPECLDIARENRRYLYRAVRYLARDVGITQFLDLGSGYPTSNNVHQVAQYFQPDARVAYVDIDPIVLTHGRALLADTPNTAIITADITDTDAVLGAPEVTRLLDLSQPVAVLMFSIPHCIPDDETARNTVRGVIDRAAPGSHVAFSHVVCDTQEMADSMTATFSAGVGLPWQTRVPETVTAWLDGLSPVDPGLGDINDWRPDPDQPPLPDGVPAELARFSGATQRHRRLYEFGGVLRK